MGYKDDVKNMTAQFINTDYAADLYDDSVFEHPVRQVMREIAAENTIKEVTQQRDELISAVHLSLKNMGVTPGPSEPENMRLLAEKSDAFRTELRSLQEEVRKLTAVIDKLRTYTG